MKRRRKGKERKEGRKGKKGTELERGLLEKKKSNKKKIVKPKEPGIRREWRKKI